MKNWKFGVLALGFMICLAFQTQQEKQAVLTLTKADMENLWSIVDDAAVPGTIRRPLLLKLEIAYNAAFTAKPLEQQTPVKQDTTKPKPKKN